VFNVYNNLNLSDNNLPCKIPTGTQIQSFGASSYASNRYFCGLTLLKMCLGDEASQGPQIGNTHREGNIQEQQTPMNIYGFVQALQSGSLLALGEFVDR
jgi:hypothetical protein